MKLGTVFVCLSLCTACNRVKNDARVVGCCCCPGMHARTRFKGHGRSLLSLHASNAFFVWLASAAFLYRGHMSWITPLELHSSLCAGQANHKTVGKSGLWAITALRIKNLLYLQGKEGSI